MKRLLTLCILILFISIFASQIISSQSELKTNQQKVQSKEEFLPQPNKTNDKSSNKSSESTIIGTFVKSIFVLLIFLLITYFILKKIQKRKMNAIQTDVDGVISVLKTSSLTSNKSIQIVEIAKKIYILGLGDQMISVINMIDEPKEIEEIKNQCGKESKPNKPRNFKDIFSSYFSVKPKSDLNNKILASTNNSLKFFNEQRNKLKELKNKF
ncbi:MAG: flagellar biosynthetic protein FliO [Spirochaetota bacterium]|nr:flagellar biosynthetic protein FliO [Spirochaetota bacterium]